MITIQVVKKRWKAQLIDLFVCLFVCLFVYVGLFTFVCEYSKA